MSVGTTKANPNIASIQPNCRGERIRSAISLRGIRKLTGLAAEIGVTEGALTRWRQGGPMSLENSIRFCQLLDISLDWLAMGRGHADYQERTIESGRRRLLAALDALPVGIESDLIRFLERIATAGEPTHSPQ